MSEGLKRRLLIGLGLCLLALGGYFLLNGRLDHQVALFNGTAVSSAERVKAAPGWGLLLCTLGGATLISVARRP
jgi:hypothetical protein